MLKVVVYDSGFGGELFADYLKEELPILEIIKIIDWRNAEKILSSPHKARKLAEVTLRPYINKVDLIIFANHLITATSLRYFRQKYRNQSFLGFSLKKPDTFVPRDVLILTTRAMSRTFVYKRFVYTLRRKTKTLAIDPWIGKIDDGELGPGEIKETLKLSLKTSAEKFHPSELILGASQLSDIKVELKEAFSQKLKINDSFPDTLKQVYKTLRLKHAYKTK